MKTISSAIFLVNKLLIGRVLNKVQKRNNKTTKGLSLSLESSTLKFMILICFDTNTDLVDQFKNLKVPL